MVARVGNRLVVTGADRIAVTGGSYGGHMTLAVSTFYSDRIRCSVDIVGMSNLVTFLETLHSPGLEPARDASAPAGR